MKNFIQFKFFNIKLISIVLLLGSLASHAQTKEFTFYDNIGEIKEPLSLSVYTQGNLLNIQSDTKGKVSIVKELIDKADSIFVNHSFYRLPLKKEEFTSDNIKLEPEISLEKVVLKERKKQFLGPDQKKRGKVLSEGENIFNSILTLNLNNKNIVGIRYRFKNSSYHNIKSSNKRFKILLLGFNKEPQRESLAKVNLNRAYDLLEDSSITVSIPEDFPKWVEVYFDSKAIDYNNYKYIAFGLVPIDPSIIIEGSKQKHFPNFEEVKIFIDATFNGVKGNYVHLSYYHKRYEGKLFSIQLILR